MANREYKDEFLSLGFTYITRSGVQRPQCVICGQVLSNKSLKSQKLRRHLEGNHSALVNRDRSFFERKEQQLNTRRVEAPTSRSAHSIKQATLASYHIAWEIAKSKEPHVIGEELVLPATLEVVQTMLGAAAAKKIERIPLSGDTVTERIKNMSCDIKEQVIADMKMSGQFSLQLDESTDLSDDAQLMVFVRYQGTESMEEEFLFCQPLHITSTGEDIFKLVDTFFKEEGLQWNQCFSVCYDDVPSMVGVCQDFIARVKNENPRVLIVRSLLHRENLVYQTFSNELQNVMQEIIQIVNLIKFGVPNSSIFFHLCSDFGSEHAHLLDYSKVRWLSRGNVLQRLLEMRNELEIFLVEGKHPLAQKLSDSKWMMLVAYLADIFDKVNALNLSMQDRDQTLVGLAEKLTAFKHKLKLWKSKIEAGNTASFPSLNMLVVDKSFSLAHVQSIIADHVSSLISEFDGYIPENTMKYTWVRNPFSIKVEDLSEEIANISQLQEQLIEVQNDGTLQYELKNQKESLGSFWIKVYKEKPVLGGEALKMLLPFVTTCLCEEGFSALVAIRKNDQNRLLLEHDLRCCLSSKSPRFEELVKGMPCQGSP